MPDEFADPSPWHTSEVQERHPSVSEIVRRERWDAGGGAGSHQCRAEAVGSEALEDLPLRKAIVARQKPGNGFEQHVGHVNPPRPSRLRYGCRDAPATPRFVDV
ncbi:MAG TPA: hypothetical protein VF002_07870, partial [Gaiellaceae bacterium]